VQFVPPVLARQGAPVILPPDLRRMLQNEVVISLRVAVDESGRVTGVVPVNRLGRTEQSLARSYELAIRSWEFDPAKRNGAPAPGEVVMNFRVSP
jgi:outer membrane biosynthesis protein TonB